MSLPNIKEIQTLTISEIENEILLTKKQLFELRLKRVTRQGFKSHLFKHCKHRLSQLLMVQAELLSKEQTKE